MDDAKSDSGISPGERLALETVHLRYRLFQTVTVGVFILTGLGLILNFLVEVWNKDPWVAITGGVITMGGPTAVLWRFRATFRRYTRTDHQRVRYLEGQIDAHRESSGLSDEGVGPEVDE